MMLNITGDDFYLDQITYQANRITTLLENGDRRLDAFGTAWRSLLIVGGDGHLKLPRWLPGAASGEAAGPVVGGPSYDISDKRTARSARGYFDAIARALPCNDRLR